MRSRDYYKIVFGAVATLITAIVVLLLTRWCSDDSGKIPQIIVTIQTPPANIVVSPAPAPTAPSSVKPSENGAHRELPEKFDLLNRNLAKLLQELEAERAAKKELQKKETARPSIPLPLPEVKPPVQHRNPKPVVLVQYRPNSRGFDVKSDSPTKSQLDRAIQQYGIRVEPNGNPRVKYHVVRGPTVYRYDFVSNQRDEIGWSSREVSTVKEAQAIKSALEEWCTVKWSVSYR